MTNDLLTIGNFTIHTYGVMIAVGIIVAYIVGEYRAKRRGFDIDKFFNMVIFGVVGSLIGAKVLFYIVEIKTIIANPKLLLDIGNGFVVYGGIICAVLICFVYCRKQKLNFRDNLDIVMPSLALGQAFGRVGCIAAGCCYGRETTSSFHFEYNGVWRVPTQGISAALNLLNFLVLVFLANKVFKRKGQTASASLIFYSIGRFIVEIFRADARGSVGALSTSQFISVLTFVGGVCLFVYSTWLGKKENSFTLLPGDKAVTENEVTNDDNSKETEAEKTEETVSETTETDKENE
ncbi:MAG: prolipoprotein diacylglyceryl transferase [Lachnospiraceae bacterium]|nr:prolipoprotein diacylglyceryl transferase [Lachnospiraceae bacterium]